MIHRIFSSLPSFKALELHPDLNVLIAQKEAGATDKQTRNRAGKTSLIEIIHFLTGADAGTDSPFRSEALAGEFFGLALDLGGNRVTVQRSGKRKSQVHVTGGGSLNGKSQLSNTEWMALLGEKMFGLDNLPKKEGRAPTFRSLFAYFVRRQVSGAFTTPEKHDEVRTFHESVIRNRRDHLAGELDDAKQRVVSRDQKASRTCRSSAST